MEMINQSVSRVVNSVKGFTTRFSIGVLSEPSMETIDTMDLTHKKT